MALDPSALLAILQDEPERGEFNESIKAASQRRLSPASFVELSIAIVARQGAEGLRDLERGSCNSLGYCLTQPVQFR